MFYESDDRFLFGTCIEVMGSVRSRKSRRKARINNTKHSKKLKKKQRKKLNIEWWAY